MSKTNNSFGLEELGSILESLSKLDYLDQEKLDKIVQEMVNRWIY